MAKFVPTVTVRSLYAYDADAVSEETGLRCTEPSLARQSEKEEADINTIVKNFGITGKLPVGVRAPSYGDFEGVSDYATAIAAIKAAEASFLAMPAEVRARFENSPQAFLEFLEEPSNYDEAVKLGLAIAKPDEAPAAAPGTIAAT